MLLTLICFLMILPPICCIATFSAVFIAIRSTIYYPILLKLLNLISIAQMVKLVDTLDLGSSAFGMGVQVPLWAPSHPLTISSKVQWSARLFQLFSL